MSSNPAISAKQFQWIKDTLLPLWNKRREIGDFVKIVWRTFDENPWLKEKAKEIYETESTAQALTFATVDVATCITAFLASIYLFYRVYKLAQKVDDISSNTDKYERELTSLYEDQIKPLLEVTDHLLRRRPNKTRDLKNIEKLIIEYEGLLGDLQKMLQKIDAEIREVRSRTTDANFLIVMSIIFGTVAVLSAYLDPPVDLKMLIVVFSCVAFFALALLLAEYRSDLKDQGKKLNKLLENIYQYKGEATSMRTNLHLKQYE